MREKKKVWVIVSNQELLPGIETGKRFLGFRQVLYRDERRRFNGEYYTYCAKDWFWIGELLERNN